MHHLKKVPHSGALSIFSTLILCGKQFGKPFETQTFALVCMLAFLSHAYKQALIARNTQYFSIKALAFHFFVGVCSKQMSHSMGKKAQLSRNDASAVSAHPE